MIDDLDKTLDELLKRELPQTLLDHIVITFATPDSEFPPTGVTLPALNIFLYDIRENTELRSPEWIVSRDADGVTTRRRAPVRVDCSYLVTAWPSPTIPNPPHDEHQILGAVMKVLLRHRTIPEALLQGSLQGQDLPLPTVALHSSELQSWGDFWQAIGSKPKVALNYKITISMDAERAVETELPVIEKVIKLAPDLEVVA
jgi:hypothetical protein